MTTTDNSRADALTKNPMQPIITDRIGTLRFKENAIVRYLLDNGGIDMNKLAMLEFTDADREQFAQLIGYSVSGYGELSYVSDESYDRAILAASPVEQHEAAPAAPALSERELDAIRSASLNSYMTTGQRDCLRDLLRRVKAAPLEGTGNGADERAAFEAEMRDPLANLLGAAAASMALFDDERYDSDFVEAAWLAWQVRAAASQPVAAAGQETVAVKPDAWIRMDHLRLAQRAPFMCRVEPEFRSGFDLAPIYLTAPPAQVATRERMTDALRQAREELSNVEWENDPPTRVIDLFSTIDALLEGAKQ
ncbi:hypothetical protein LGM39_15130 [Burkholderia cepacia]|uniref:hypothetical protein n=1 Tax=Burkholderia cepacia TaxID=292 RepID=UPI001CF303BB|nr:hypothetical protein [Burkholderia cepacia]MCA7900711.1 hypothetical protein [Burkholderia cepacia]